MKAALGALVMLALCGAGFCLPTLYEVDSDSGDASAVMVAVASTVLPLDDLPEQTVGVGFGFDAKDKVKKPNNIKDIQLITASKNRFVYKAGVQELSKEEFEQFNVSKKK